MRIAVCPGSFDPVTLGHLDIIDRASKLFDKVIVLVSFNANKSRAAFTPTERMEMIIEATKHLDNVVVDCYNGLLADYLQKTGANAIVKGLRAVSDFEYEFQMALANKKLYNDAVSHYYGREYVPFVKRCKGDRKLRRRYHRLCAETDTEQDH